MPSGRSNLKYYGTCRRSQALVHHDASGCSHFSPKREPDPLNSRSRLELKVPASSASNPASEPAPVSVAALVSSSALEALNALRTPEPEVVTEPAAKPVPNPTWDGPYVGENGDGNGGAPPLRGASAYGGGEAASADSRNGSTTGGCTSSAGMTTTAACFRVRRRRHQSAKSASSTATTPPAMPPAIVPTSSVLEYGGAEGVTEVVAVEEDEVLVVLGQLVKFLPVSPAISASKFPRKFG
jgi:hypothetical protein